MESAIEVAAVAEEAAPTTDVTAVKHVFQGRMLLLLASAAVLVGGYGVGGWSALVLAIGVILFLVEWGDAIVQAIKQKEAQP